MTAHLDLDALADVLATEGLAGSSGLAGSAGPTEGQPVGGDHLADCAPCQARLAELRGASATVTRQLAQLPSPPLPAEVATRLAAAVRTATPPAATRPAATPPAATPPAPVSPLAAQTTLPAASSHPPRRWLPVAAAVLMVLAGAGYGVSRLTAGSSVVRAGQAGTAGRSAAGTLDLARNNTGTDYADRAGLIAALPRLLAGGSAGQRVGSGAGAAVPAPQSAPVQGTAPRLAPADPLARLRTPAGLADCLLALLPPSDPALQPLAVDYAAFKGTPAMVVVLPSSVAGKLDVFVVGAGCRRDNDSTLFYASANRP